LGEAAESGDGSPSFTGRSAMWLALATKSGIIHLIHLTLTLVAFGLPLNPNQNPISRAPPWLDVLGAVHDESKAPYAFPRVPGCGTSRIPIHGGFSKLAKC